MVFVPFVPFGCWIGSLGWYRFWPNPGKLIQFPERHKSPRKPIKNEHKICVHSAALNWSTFYNITSCFIQRMSREPDRPKSAKNSTYFYLNGSHEILIFQLTVDGIFGGSSGVVGPPGLPIPSHHIYYRFLLLF
jgi:hypothetical protein